MIDRYRSDVMGIRTGLSANWEILKLAAESGMTLGHAAAHEVSQGVHAVEHGAQHAVHTIERTAQSVAHTVHDDLRKGLHATEHAVSQGVHAVEHTARNVTYTVDENISQSVHVVEHAAQSLTSDASKAFDTLRHPGSWFDDKPTRAAPPVRLDHTTHPDHPLYQQARNAVHRLDAEHHRTPDRRSDNLAASLVVAARRDGMQAVNHVVPSNDAAQVFAVQGELNSSFKQITHVETVQASNTSVEKSSAEWQLAMQQKQPDPVHAPPMAQEQQTQQPPHPTMGL